MTPTTTTFSRYLWLIAAIFSVAIVTFLLRGAVFPFIVGGALAYILHPLVAFTEGFLPWRDRHPQLSRVTAILTVFALVLAIIAGAIALVLQPALDQFRAFMEALPDLFRTARITVESWTTNYSTKVPEEVRIQIELGLQNAGTVIAGAVQNVVQRTVSAASSALTIVIGLAIVPLFLFYSLKDRETFVDGLVSWVPLGSRIHARSTIQIINHVFSSYIRAQLLLGLVVGILVFLGMTVLGVRFSIILGVLAGVFELVPIVGPWLGAIPGIVVVLATSPDDFILVLSLYLGVQLLENVFLVPKLQSQALHVHPVIIMMVLLVGSELAGLWGIILGPPLVGGAIEVIHYFRSVWNPDDFPPEAPHYVRDHADDHDRPDELEETDDADITDSTEQAQTQAPADD